MRSLLILVPLLAGLANASQYLYAGMTLAPRQAASATATPVAPSTTYTPDSWMCATANISRFFVPPKPTGALLDGLVSFGDSLIAPCLATASGDQKSTCTVTKTGQWCPYISLAPSTVVEAYKTYRRNAAIWYAQSSSAAASARRDCPDTWKFNGAGGGMYWYNMTEWQYRCFAGYT